MAEVKLYTPVDMQSDSVIYYGEVSSYSNSSITITSGSNSTRYDGVFDFDIYGNVYGQLNGATSYLNGYVQVEVDYISRDAYTFNSLLNSGSAQNLYNYVLNSADIFHGSTGNDWLRSHEGSDTIYGGYGNDTLLGEDGSDSLYGGAGVDVLIGGAGDDFISGGTTTSDLSDSIYGGSGRDTAVAGYGDDEIWGGEGNDNLSGEAGNDTIAGDSGRDKVFGGIGADYLEGGKHRDLLIGGNGNDAIFGGGGSDRLKGNNGADTLNGGSGHDTLVGGNKNDELSGGRGNDFLTGGRGKDTFVFAKGGGYDTISDFQVGRDTIEIGRGASRFDQLGFEQAGDDVIISFSNVEITVTDMQLSQIQNEDTFIF